MTKFNPTADREGRTYKFVGPMKLYITINHDENNQPREMFIALSSSGSTLRSVCDALAKAVSIALQNDKTILPRLIKAFSGDLSEAFWHNREFKEPAKSVADAVGMVLAREEALAEVGTHGADKYSRGGWQEVPDGETRYRDADWRHLLKSRHEDVDQDSGLLHDAHRAWNVLAALELRLRRERSTFQRTAQEMNEEQGTTDESVED